MALPLSGQIDLNAIHVEAGGSSGTQCSINDADIRGLIGKASGVQMAFSEWYGASANWSATLTIGTQSGYGYTLYGYTNSIPSISNMGSLSDTTDDNLGGATIYGLYSSTVNSYSVLLRVGGNIANSGFTNLVVNGFTYPRTSASYSYDSGNNVTVWLWTGVSNFGTSGSVAASHT